MSPAEPRGARRAAVVVFAVTLACGALALNRQLVGVFYDDGLYADVAYALTHGLGYVHPHLPGHPAVVHYPPLYPLVLSPFIGMLPLEAAGLAAKVLNIILAAAAAGLVAWHAASVQLLGPEAPPWLAPLLVTGAVVALPMLTILSVLFSEPLFGVLFALAVLLADQPPAGWSPDRAALLAGGAAALALLTRTIGVAAGLGIVAYLLVVRRAPWRRAALAGAPVLASALGWLLWVARHHRGIDPGMATNYGSYFEVVQSAGLGVVWPSLRDLPRPLADLTLRWLPGSALQGLFGAAELVILGYGLVLLSRRSSIGFTLLCYIAILAAWTFPADRFIWVVLPWLALAWGAGLVRLWHAGRLRVLRVPVALAAAAVAIGYAQVEGIGLATRSWSAAPARVATIAEEVLPWVATLPPDAVIAADLEPLIGLNTGRTSVPFYIYAYRGSQVISPGPAEQRAYLERQGVTHIVTSGYVSRSAPQLDALLGAYPGWLTVVKGWRDGRAAFRINRGP